MSKQNVKKANPVIHSQLNPLVNMSEFKDADEPYYEYYEIAINKKFVANKYQ